MLHRHGNAFHVQNGNLIIAKGLKDKSENYEVLASSSSVWPLRWDRGRRARRLKYRPVD